MESATRLLLYRSYDETWRRGEKYADEGRIKVLKINEKEIEAVVSGTKDYTVNLIFRGGGIGKSCTCPHFAQSTTGKIICKHIIAAAIYWDEERGIPRPSKEEIEEYSVAPAPVSSREIQAMFNNPLKVDLEKLRILSEATALSSRAHARLPNAPKIDNDLAKPLKLSEITKALNEIESWERRSLYDPYFCCGEVTAAFCEVLDVIKNRAENSKPKEIIYIIIKCVDWYYKVYLQMIDDSEGDWIFPRARIGKLVADFYKKYPKNPEWAEFEKSVKISAEGWEDNLSIEDIISWKDEKL